MHYVISVYQGVTMGIVLISGEGVSALTQLEGELGPATYMHLIGYCVGAIVGAMGALTHWFLVPVEKEVDPRPEEVESNIEIDAGSEANVRPASE